MYANLTYYVPETSKNSDSLKEYILKHPELKFVSLTGVDFLGNETDERIPIEYFLKNLEEIFSGGVQTDGSSVNLPGIATINDAKIDFIIDFKRKWFVDYNFDKIDFESKPVGTIKIPVYFRHHDNFYCSRSVLKDSLKYLKDEIFTFLTDDNEFMKENKISKDDISDLYFTVGTELEFWVRTPVDQVSIDELAVSQVLKESYWKRTKGQIRTSLEESLILLQEYGFHPEMGHKEVGGVKGKVSKDGQLYDVMEQLEIDWRFTDPMQSADNEIFARSVIKDVFRRNGLEVTFIAKPVEGVAGSGEHTHVGVGLLLKDDRKINLFAPINDKNFLSSFGYGALMGLLKNWNYVNPFVSHSNSSLKRLQPGFEAPVCAVASLGSNPDSPSRNRTVLAGLVRSDNPLSVRFEVRAPNPHTNTYMAVSSIYLSMLDGMKYAASKTADQLEKEIYKKSGDDVGYLETDREYISEKDIFDDLTKDERDRLYGKTPSTVWEVINVLKKEKNFFKYTPLNDKIVNSFYLSALHKWIVELREKEMINTRKEISAMVRFEKKENKFDHENWKKVEKLRTHIDNFPYC